MKVFIAGPRVINELDENIVTKLKSICKKNYDVLVGDAKGVDSSVQRFLVEKNYKYVKEVILYYMPNKKFYHFKNIEEFTRINIKIDNKLKKMLPQKDINKFVQMCLF